jgi:molecular chaperone GrpE
MSRIPIDDDDDIEAEELGEGERAAQGDRDDAQDQPSNDVLQLQAERNQLYERLARVTADYQNSRRRLESEMDQRVQYANSTLIKSLLPVIDNFERALAVDTEKTDAKSILRGLQLVHDQWINVLKQQQVEEIAPEPGTPFDPTKHEALMQQHNDQYTEPTVTQLFQKGYALHGRTLRPAQVAVSKTE